MSNLKGEDPERSLCRAYRYCLRSYPAWYRLAFGDDLVAVLEESHADERRPSARECACLVVAGLKRRVVAARLDKVGAVYAIAVTLECLGAFTLVAVGITLAIEFWSSPPYPPSQLQNLAFRIGTYQHHVAGLIAYLLLLVLLATLLGRAAGNAWGRVGSPELGAGLPEDPEPGSLVMENWSALDSGALIAQPVIAFMGALAISVRVDNVDPMVGALSKDQGSVSTALLVAGLATGCVLALLMWRRMRASATKMSRAALVVVSLVALPWVAFLIAGGRFGAPGSTVAWAPVVLYGPSAPGGSDLGTGFTTVRLQATGETDPLSLACPDPERCLAFGVPWDLRGPTLFGATYSRSRDRWHVAPFSITRAETLTAPFEPISLACPETRTCYVLDLNARQQAGLARSSDGGSHWLAIDLPFKREPLNTYGVAETQAVCMSVNACVFAVTQGFAVTSDGGSSWVDTTAFSSLPVPGGLGAQGELNSYLAGVSCPSTGVCFVAVEIVKRSRGYESSTTWLLATHDEGRTWTRSPIRPLTVRASDLGVPMLTSGSFACSDALDCVLIVAPEGRALPLVLATADGGESFATVRAPTAWGQNDISVTCDAGLVCWALPISEAQQEIWRSLDGGRHWTRASSLPDGVAFGATQFRYAGATAESGIFACPSSTRCTAIAHRPGRGSLQPNVFVSTTDGGRIWKVERIPVLPAPCRPRPPIVD